MTQQMTQQMTIEQAVTKFHWCCQAIVQHKDEKSLNYAVHYASRGLSLERPYFVSSQIPYILCNMTHWRSDLATKVRRYLKEVLDVLKEY